MSTTTTTLPARERQRRIRTRDGISLAVSDWGTGADPSRTVVFLHGLCLSHDAWRIQRNHVLRRFGDDVRVIAYDHRGHGASGSAPLHTYRIEQLVADLDDVLDALKVRGPLILAGHSMGAMAALTYLSEGVRGSDVVGLVLCAAAAGNLSSQGIGRLLELPVINPLTNVMARVPVRATGALTAPLRFMLNRVRAAGGKRSGAFAGVVADALANTPLGTAVGFLASLRDFDQTPYLAAITAHTTILSGGLDPLTPASLSRAMAAAIPGAAHIHIPAAGHMLLHEQARTVNAAVAAAIAAVPQALLHRGVVAAAS